MKKNQLMTLQPNVETRDLNKMAAQSGGNLFESLVIVAKRSNQINMKLKEELHAKLNEFASVNDNLEEVFENREQIEISKYYEKLPNSVIIALDEFSNDEIYYRRADEQA
jgi:DNA-directed RNA polymerase subunit K/omega